MRPLDPRLLRRARSARRYVALTAALGTVTAGLVIGQALLLASVLAPVVTREADWPDVAPLVGVLCAVVAVRVLVTSIQERFAHRAATGAVAELREQVLTHALRLGPRWLDQGNAASTTILATRGLDALEPYFVRYLPQLLLVGTVTPAVLLVILGLDWVAALTIIVTIPLVPIFMSLVGRLTQGYARRRLDVMARLGHQVLDLLTGLPTLHALGRERGPAARVAELGDAHRRATMGTLRVAFLSGLVLELLTTLSVALVAVGVGFRLVGGGMDLRTGLAVLVLAPEVYLPLRQVGAHFHASADGVAAAERVFEILDTPAPVQGTVPAPDLRATTVRLRGVGVAQPDRATTAPADLDLDLPPGRVVALTGSNGAGKSTTVGVLLGFVRPDAGSVRVHPLQGGEVDLGDVDLTSWWSQIAWVPQRPALDGATVRDAVVRERDVPHETLTAAAALTGLDGVVRSLPEGWETRLGRGGVGLSVGERQRVALTRALVGAEPLVVLDEPTAHLDAEAVGVVVRAVQALSESGRTVLVVGHHPALLACADTVVTVRASDVLDPRGTAKPFDAEATDGTVDSASAAARSGGT